LRQAKCPLVLAQSYRDTQKISLSFFCPSFGWTHAKKFLFPLNRTLHELSVMKHIREENFGENFETALEDGIDYIGEQFLRRTIDPKQT
jgi:hypothetical protein